MYKQMDPQILNDFRQTSGTDFQNSSAIGGPQTVVSGQFEGKTIRCELQELQKAELGRN